MNNSNKIAYVVIVAMALVGLAAYLFIKSYIPKYKWHEDYVIENDQPYGLKFLFDVLSSSHAKSDFVVLKKDLFHSFNENDTNALYIFIGSEYICDSINSSKLVEFVSNGNNAFISSISSTHSIFSILTDNEMPLLNYLITQDSLAEITFDSSHYKYKFEHREFKKNTIYSWVGFDRSYFSDSISIYGFEKISLLDGYYIDCFRIKTGKGYFIFHFNPILLSNYTLTGKNGFQYINELLLPYNKKKIYWDEYSKRNEETTDTETQSPLRFILSQKSLRWAWYLICFIVLLFVIINSKRKQAHIPIMPANTNHTIEYINSISALYYKSGAAVYLADQILKHLLIFIKHKYGISPDMKKHEIAKLLAPLSGIPEDILNKMFNYYNGVKYSPYIENKDLIEFYKLTEYFYKNCK